MRANACIAVLLAAMTCGWLSFAIARASRRKRSTNAGSTLTSSGSSLDRDEPVERGLARLINRAHAATAEQTDHFVSGKKARGFAISGGSHPCAPPPVMRTLCIARANNSSGDRPAGITGSEAASISSGMAWQRSRKTRPDGERRKLPWTGISTWSRSLSFLRGRQVGARF